MYFDLDDGQELERNGQGDLYGFHITPDGQSPKTLRSAISERERELRRITDRLLEPRPESLSSRLDGLRAFAVSQINNLRKLISQPESVDQARAALAEFFGGFTLDPSAQAGESAYGIRSEVDFFGGDSLA